MQLAIPVSISGCLTLAVSLGVLANAGPVRGQTLDWLPAEQRSAVTRGAEFLDKSASDGRLGAMALAGRVMLAIGQRDNHRVAEALEAIRGVTSKPIQTDLYSVGLSIVFLVELDAEAHEAEIRTLVDHLLAVQKPHGGWGYANRTTGDTSITQYAVLGLWSAEQAGFSVPGTAWENVTNWLLRTQAPNGLWGYQGTDPGNYTRVPQLDTSRNLTVAALGSLYMAGHRLGLVSLQTRPEELHPAFSRVARPTDLVDLPEQPAAEDARGVDVARYREALRLGNQVIDSSGFPPVRNYLWYYAYSLERYHALREAVEARWSHDPEWFADMAAQVLSQQQANHSWHGAEGPVPATSFCILFLTRSMQLAIRKVQGLGTGMLVGGRGLPATAGAVELELGRVREQRLMDSADALLSHLDNPQHANYAPAVAALAELQLPSDEPVPTHLAARLRALARGDDVAARRAALLALGRCRDLDQAPVLIEALLDPSPDVHEAAWEGLRLLRRRLTPGDPSVLATEASRRLEADRWKAWLLSIRPDARVEFVPGG